MLLVSCDDFLEVRSPEDNMKAQEEKELVRQSFLSQEITAPKLQHYQLNY